jgi:ATP-dependent DNA helicase RecG
VVWVISIPKHNPREPVHAHNEMWQRMGEVIVRMKDERRQTILSEVYASEDWTAAVVEGATIDDLDDDAVRKARVEYKKRNPKYADEMENWDEVVFLNKAGFTKKGRLTRAAIILLGKPESERLLDNIADIKIRWLLKTVEGRDKAVEIFSCPFIVAVDAVYSKIRNLNYVYINLKKGSIFPEETLRYEPFNIREALNNCIAHQDYSKGAMINVVEIEDERLIFSNYGSFITGNVEKVVTDDCPEEQYRNPFLVACMRNVNMVETQGGGIRKMFNNQKKRLFPMPDYDFSGNKVRVTLTGKVIDPEFADILTKNPNLSLTDIILLDKVQKKLALTETEARRLRALRFIEGRKPNYYLSAKVVQPTGDAELKAQYIKNRGIEEALLKERTLEYIRRYKRATKKDVTSLLLKYLSDVLTERQKKAKIQNLLSALRMSGKIKYDGEYWVTV